MLVRRHLLYLLLLFVARAIALAETAQCPADSAAIHFRSPGSSQITIPIFINHSGPWEFSVDTGSDITVMDPNLAAQLGLQPQGSIQTGFVTNYARADLVKPEVVEVGPISVRDLAVSVQGLKQIQTLYPKVRGILGENFLGRFDMLIDYRHKLICLDSSKEIQKELKGERVPVVPQTELDGDLAYALPVLVTVHVEGDKEKGTILRVDSGSSHPMLYENHLEPLSFDNALQISVTGQGGSLRFGVMSSRGVRIGSDMTRQIAFIAPVTARSKAIRTGEAGLLPTALFNRVFISSADHFVMFEPQ
jgi:hypothetical protein